MSQARGVFTFASRAPDGLPDALFPQHLGPVLPGIDDLALDYDAEGHELRIALTMPDDAEPERAVIGAMYRDSVIALVDHISFELSVPLDLPTPGMYEEAAGNRVLFLSGVASAVAFGSAAVAPQTDVFVRRISTLVPASPLLQEFNAIVRIADPVQQFLAYWALLTHLAGKGSVNAVEVYLHSRGVPDEPTPGPHGAETKFARVRGEISHALDRGVQPSRLAKCASTVLSELRSVVRAAIADTLGLPS